jgi:hypothetical protein
MGEVVGGGDYVALDSFDSGAAEDLVMAPLASGGLAVAWISGGALEGYLLDANGNGGNLLILGDAADKMSGDLRDLSLAPLPTGGFVAAWTEFDGDIATRVFDSSGAPTGPSHILPTGGAFGTIGQPSLAGLQSGGFVIAYAVSNDGDGEGVRAQIFDATGARVGADFAVNSLTAGDQELPVAVSLANGGFLISWADSGGHSYAGQFYDSAGQAIGGQVSLAPGGDSVYGITALASGNFVIVWPAGDGELHGQIFTVDGAKVGAEFQINDPTPGIDMLPDITALASGGFAVAWTSPTAAGDGDIHA